MIGSEPEIIEKMFIGEVPSLIIAEEGKKLVAYESGRKNNIYHTDTIFVTFYDDERSIVHIQAISEPNKKTGYKGGFKTRFLYSKAESGEENEKDNHIITATGYRFEGSVEFLLGENAERGNIVDMHHIRVDEERENMLDEIFENKIREWDGYKESDIPIRVKLAVYDYYIRRYYMQDRLFETHIQRLYGLATVPFPSLVEAMKSYGSIKKNLTVLKDFFS